MHCVAHPDLAPHLRPLSTEQHHPEADCLQPALSTQNVLTLVYTAEAGE